MWVKRGPCRKNYSKSLSYTKSLAWTPALKRSLVFGKRNHQIVAILQKYQADFDS